MANSPVAVKTQAVLPRYSEDEIMQTKLERWCYMVKVIADRNGLIG
jgi:hypothetical protein